MEMISTFQKYFAQGTVGPGTGTLQGQCAVFAQYFYELPKFGDSLAEKKKTFDKYGIPFNKLNGHFEIGDIVLTQEEKTHGHIYIVGDIKAPYLIAAESNYRNPKRLDYTRIVPVSTLIYGVIRGAKLKVPIVNPPLQKTFMKITVVPNNSNWITLQGKLDTLKKWFIDYSDNRFEPVFDIKQTAYNNIPFERVTAQPADCVQIDFYRKNITPLATGQATLFIVNPDQYKPIGSFGMMTWGDYKKPVRIEITGYESELIIVERMFHEICHALLFLSDQPDVDPDNPANALVHKFLYQNPPKFKEMMNYIDYKALQNKLITIK